VSDYETTQRKRNITVGIFVLIALCALMWLIYRFGDLPMAVSKLRSFQVFVQFPTAQGVQEDTPVRLSGYRIGRVTKVMAPEVRPEIRDGKETALEYHQTLVVLSIGKKYVNIPYNSEVKLMTRGLGSSYIEIKTPLPDPNKPVAKFLEEGSLLQGSAGMTSEFFPEESQKKLEELVDGLGTLINNANEIIGDKANKENFKTALINLAEATNQATQTVKGFQEFAAAGTNALKNADTGVDKIVAAFVGTSEELSKTTAELRVLLEKVNSGEGSAARFVNDGKLYENLLESTRQLELLLEELKSFVKKSRDKGLPIKLK